MPITFKKLLDIIIVSA